MLANLMDVCDGSYVAIIRQRHGTTIEDNDLKACKEMCLCVREELRELAEFNTTATKP